MKAPTTEKATTFPGLSAEELMGRYREEGREEDLTELIHRYERELYRYLVRYLGDRTLAEDVFQNTFLQVHSKRALYEDGRPVRPWLYAIATHQAVDALRKIGRHPTVSLDQSTSNGGEEDAGSLIQLLTSNAPGPLREMQEAERIQWVKDSIARLPDSIRQTLVMAYYDDLKYREIAEILKIPVGTVKSRLHAAIGKLAEMARGANIEDGDPSP
jgi:RNA polymerase sigma-70 factor (ECF subfamily)